MNWALKALELIMLRVLTLLLLLSHNLHARTVYSDVDPEPLAQEIAQVLRADLKKKNITYEQKRAEIARRLEELKPFAEAVNYLEYYGKIGQLLFSNSDFFVQNAFVDLSLADQLPRENWFSAYIYMAQTASLRWSHLREPFDFVNDPDVLNKTKQHLELVSDDRYHQGTFTAKPEEKERENEVLSALANYGGRIPGFSGHLSDDEQEQKRMENYVQKLNRLASPLFHWFVQARPNSLTPAQVFHQAHKIYGDPWTGLGVTAWIIAYEANQSGHRKRAALAASRLRPVIHGARDHAGTIYHFWTYFVHSLFGQPTSPRALDLFSYAWERLHQNDMYERATDRIAIELGQRVDALLK